MGGQVRGTSRFAVLVIYLCMAISDTDLPKIYRQAIKAEIIHQRQLVGILPMLYRIDAVSMARINKLHPSVRDEVKQILHEINSNLSGRAQVRITQGLRTFSEQEKLFAQRPRVTRARAGQSVHNYGFAIDFVLLIDGKEISWNMLKDWDADGIPDWTECVLTFAKYGWSWGGNWSSFRDFPHFDKIGFNNWRALAKLRRGSDGYVII